MAPHQLTGITTLVPAFKLDYFRRLLVSLATQHVKPNRVIVSDDTPGNDFSATVLKNDEIRSLLRQVDGQVIRGPKRGYHENVRYLLAEYRKQSTAFFHILLDDDELSPDFYKDHYQAHLNYQTVCCVSRRLIVSVSENQTRLPAVPSSMREVAPGIARISLDQMIESFVIRGEWNWLGELSCMTLRHEFLDIEEDFNSFNGIGLEGMNDIGTLLKSASVSDVIFLTEPKGLFRVHEKSISFRKGYFYSLSILCKLILAIALQRRQKISKAAVLSVAQRVHLQWQDAYGQDVVSGILRRLIEVINRDYERFEQSALAFWSSYKELTAISSKLSDREALMRHLRQKAVLSSMGND